MAKELLWSKDTVILNRTLDDSLDLLFCQDMEKTNTYAKQAGIKTGIRGIIALIKEIRQ